MKIQRQAPKEIPSMFDGRIIPLTLRIATPVLLSNFLQFFYAIVDTFFVSRIDPSSTALLSGTGLMFPMFMLFMSMGFSISVGLSSLVGRVIGERNDTAAGHLMPSGFALVICIAFPVLLCGYVFGDAIVRALAGSGLSEEAMGYGRTYFLWLLPGLVIMLLSHVFMGTLQGEGRTGAIARAMILSTLCNVVLDPICIFVLGMGVAGAALATTISVCAAAVYVVAVFVRGHTTTPLSLNIFRASRRAVGEIVRIGFPHFLSMASLSISFMVINKVVGSIGQTAMNAWTVAGRMDQAVLIPSFAVGGATISIIAQNFGRGNLDRVRQVYRGNIALGMLMVAAAAVVYNLVAPLLFSLFSDVPEVVAGAVRQVRVLSFTFVGVSVAIISASAFQATGRPLPALLLTLFRLGLIALPTVLVLVYVAGLGMTGVYAGLAAGNILICPAAYVVTSRHLANLRYRQAL